MPVQTPDLLHQAHTIAKDTGAAQAVVEQAGGRVETIEGQPLSYATAEQHLNPHFIVWGSA